MRLIAVFLCVFFVRLCEATVHPLSFSVSETKMIKEVPSKDQDFAFLIPGDMQTYIYDNEEEYYQDYRRSYFALTWKKGGWDCMRHYEILSNGCIPYFIDLEKCDSQTMFFLPRELILEAMHLEGVSYPNIDHEKFDKVRYYEILKELLEYTRIHLTAKSMAQYVLDTIQYSGTGKILYLGHNPDPDYLRCCTLIGFKELLQDRVVDYPKIGHIYKSYPGNVKELYGKGFTYAQVVDDLPINRDAIEERIRNKEFDIVIYGSVHRGLPFHDLVAQVYGQEKILYFCGEDAHTCPYGGLFHFFLREFEALK